MAYVVLARKWRPQKFKDLVGQEHVEKTLVNAINNGKVSHAFLFTGTRGVGKTTSARILAKALNCLDSQEGEPCCQCKNCEEISAGRSIDVLEIDGASNRGVEDIRELREQVKYAPMHGAHKIFIIDEVHMLTKEAFNALLKTLEEPPSHVVFIFATTEIRKVPQTILSRVQRYDFKRISQKDIADRLSFICKEEKIEAEAEALNLVAQRAQGSMRDALSFLDQVYSFSGQKMPAEDVRRVLGIPPFELFEQLFQNILDKNTAACFLSLEEFYNLGIEIPEVVHGFGHFLRNLLYAKQKGIEAETLGIDGDKFARYTQLGQKLSDGDILRMGHILSQLSGQLKSSFNPQLALEMGVAKMASLDGLVQISQLLKSNLTGESPEEKKKGSDSKLIEELAPEPKSEAIPQDFEEVPAPLSPPPPKYGELTQSSPEDYYSPTAVKDAPRPEEEDYEEEEEPDPSISFVSSLSNLREMCERWNELVGELIQVQPLFGNRFTDSRAEWDKAQAKRVELVITNPSFMRIIQSDRGCLKDLKLFLDSKFEHPPEFNLEIKAEFSEEEDKKQGQGLDLNSFKNREEYHKEIMEKEPIIKYIFDKFEAEFID